MLLFKYMYTKTVSLCDYYHYPGRPRLEELYDCYASCLYGMTLQEIEDAAIAQTIVCSVFKTAYSQLPSFDRFKSTAFTWLSGLLREELNRHRSGTVAV